MDDMPGYYIRRTSDITAELPEYIEISANQTHRKVMKVHLLDKAEEHDVPIAVSFRHQRRKASDDEWCDPEHFSAGSLKAGQEVQYKLSHHETLTVFRALSRLYDACEHGIPHDSGLYRLVSAETGEIIGRDEAEVLRLLVEKDPDILRKLREADPDSFDRFVENELLQSRRRAVSQFSVHMRENDWSESDWAKFFENNKWIFGYGLSYRFLNLLAEQPHLGGQNVDGSGTQISDYMMVSRGNAQFIVLVEIKRPDTPLVQGKYRDQAHHISKELGGSVAQVQSQCEIWAKASEQANNVREFESKGIYTCQPRGIVVIGDAKEFAEKGGDGAERLTRMTTFERFRRNLHNPEILTYDELLARAEYIVGMATD